MKKAYELSQAELKKLNTTLDQLERSKDPKDVLVDNASFQQRFKIGRRTAYNWRRKNLLKFLTIESKVFYRLSDIREFLERHAGEMGKSQVGSPKSKV